MSTRVFRIDVTTVDDISLAIVQACDTQLAEGFKLASSFVWQYDIILIFQKL
jgi:hypothetical protein